MYSYIFCAKKKKISNPHWIWARLDRSYHVINVQKGQMDYCCCTQCKLNCRL